MESLLSGALDLFHDSYTFRVAGEMGAIFRSILPGLVIGVAVSSWLVVGWPLERVRAWRLTGGFGAVVFMACLGAVSPFCSYLAIPIAAALILGGVQPAPVIAFLCSTPLINPTLFAMTWSAFGWPMAVARVMAALGFGLLGGVLASRYSERLSRCLNQQSPETPLCLQPQNREDPFIRRWWRSFRHLGWFALKYVLLGVCIAAVVKELVPMRWIEAAVGRQYGHGVLAGALLGVPLYACGGGTIPLIQVLMSMGMSHGAALAFFVAGPAAKLSTLAVLRVTTGTAIMSVYILLSVGWSLITGIVYQFFRLG